MAHKLPDSKGNIFHGCHPILRWNTTGESIGRVVVWAVVVWA